MEPLAGFGDAAFLCYRCQQFEVTNLESRVHDMSLIHSEDENKQ
jgi:hypothetical protein